MPDFAENMKFFFLIYICLVIKILVGMVELIYKFRLLNMIHFDLNYFPSLAYLPTTNIAGHFQPDVIVLNSM